MRDVVITGMGVILNNCDRKETFWKQVREGESQLQLGSWPDVSEHPVVTGKVHNFSPER